VAEEEHYLDRPADQFRTRRRLGKATGARRLGVNLSRLRPGQMSSRLHSHSIEEEFLFVLEGRAVLRHGSAEHTVGPGDAVSLLPGGPAHQLHNPFDDDCLYLDIGIRDERDVISYQEPVEERFSAVDGGPAGQATPSLTTRRLRLRPLDVRDAEALLSYRSDPDVARFQNWRPSRLPEARAFIAKHTAHAPGTKGCWFQLAIVLRDTGELIGDCGLHVPEHLDHQAEVGITIAPAHQGHGFATEALGVLMDYLFEELEVHRVYGSADPRNLASLRLMEKVGMRREAHFRSSLLIGGVWCDDVVCAILRSEWIRNGSQDS
jgi:RimJ/RimL family protein N-acetyltransferase/quercetin dioxygenase-like cupin family protein